MIFFVITMLVAAAGCFLAIKLKVPAGALVGSMVAVMIVNILWGKCTVPGDLRVAAKIAAGMLIGTRITRQDIKGLKKVFLPAIILIAILMVFGMSLGYLIYRVTSLDIITSMLASAPGGISDMSLFAEELGADTPKVAVLQLLRLIFCIGAIPVIVNAVCSKSNLETVRKAPGEDRKEDKRENTNANAAEKAGAFVLAGIIGSIGGITGYKLGIPAGALVGAAVLTTLYNVFLGTLYVPPAFRRTTQLSVGAIIGSGMTMADLIGLKDVLLPGIILVLTLMVINITAGLLIHKLCGFDVATALFATAPGGTAEMTMAADDMGADTSKVAVLQIIRLTSVIVLYPVLFKLII